MYVYDNVGCSAFGMVHNIIIELVDSISRDGPDMPDKFLSFETVTGCVKTGTIAIFF